MAHSSNLAWMKNSMDRGAWWATVLGGGKKLDTTEQLTHTDRQTDRQTHTHNDITQLAEFLSLKWKRSPRVGVPLWKLSYSVFYW